MLFIETLINSFSVSLKSVSLPISITPIVLPSSKKGVMSKFFGFASRTDEVMRI